MSISSVFIHRPIATALLTSGLVLAGVVAFILLPVAPLPQVDLPVISVQAAFPGASPETMASTIATPLERSLGRISGITEMTSQSTLGATRINIQFDIDRNIDGAARDVQAAIEAARALLPSGIPKNPTYRKVNPADAPIMIIALTSATMRQGELYDAGSTILAQKISQIDGVGQVTVAGSALPGVRVEVNMTSLNKYGIGLEDVHTAISSANPNRPKGVLEDGTHRWQIYANDQAQTAKEYLPLIVSYYNNAPVRISDIGTAIDTVSDIRNAGSSNGKPAVSLLVFKQPNSNIIETVDRINKALPNLRKAIPAAANIDIMMDRTTAIRSSLHDVESTLFISVVLVIFVVFIFLRNTRATLIPCVAVPVSLIGTCAIMYLCNFSLDVLSLMALTIATGFVVDDAIVVLENSARHLETGLSPVQAAEKGAAEVGFTVISMSISLIAVFVPILFMGGVIGRMFREFAVTLSAAVMVSLVVSLTLTPMMCARYLRPHTEDESNVIFRYSKRFFDWMQGHYARSLTVALNHSAFMLCLLVCVIIFNVFLFKTVHKDLFPQQDSGRLQGMIQADQDISFQLIKKDIDTFVDIVRKDPDVQNVVSFTGNGQRNGGNMFVMLKPWATRSTTSDGVINRLRPKTSKVPGAKLFLQTQQDVRFGGRTGNAQYQYTLQSADLPVLREWVPKVVEELKHSPVLTDVSTDQQDGGTETYITYDRDTMSRFGITPSAADAALSDAFSQRQVSTIYNPLNQYEVVLIATDDFWQNQDGLKSVYVKTPTGLMVPLSTFTTVSIAATPLAVNHQGQFAAGTVSFNLAPGMSLDQAKVAIDAAFKRLKVPEGVTGSFQGTAKLYEDSVAGQPMLIFAALLTIYIVLGMLYESYIHPVTILSTLPSAGVGAILALMICGLSFTVIALIGVLLLIGIVKKNAILMIDFAVDAERRHDLSPYDAIYQACMMRFRPIMMTTMAALFGAIPLALGFGEGAEVRQPLGVSIVGGLIVSQLLTLYTTPVVYLAFDRLRIEWARAHNKPLHGGQVKGVV